MSKTKKKAGKEISSVNKNFQTGGVDYIGKVYTNGAEYVSLLAEKHGKSEEEVFSLLCTGYQSLNMTRIAQAKVKSKEGLNDGDVVEVLTLPGTKASKWGNLSKYVKEASKLIIDSGKVAKDDLTDDMIIKVATKLREHDMANPANVDIDGVLS